MENLIRDIIELDKKKRLELKELESEKSKIGSFLREKRQEIEKKYKAEADKIYNNRKDEIDKIISEAKVETEKNYKNSLKKLDTTFTKHQREWVDSLYDYCVNFDAKEEV